MSGLVFDSLEDIFVRLDGEDLIRSKSVLIMNLDIEESLCHHVMAESGGSDAVGRRVGGQPGGTEQFVMQIPTKKVGLVIGKGGETIKNMQASTGARIKAIPLHPLPDCTIRWSK
nr:far upstream element-binding protein 2-like [Tanacetum cinerariifolium]